MSASGPKPTVRRGSSNHISVSQSGLSLCDQIVTGLEIQSYSAQPVYVGNEPVIILFCAGQVGWGPPMRHLSIAVIAAASTVACTQMATAADMPVKAPVQKASVVVPYNWTGFYIGANIGGGWGSSDVDFSPNDPIAALFSLPPTSLKISGVLGGLQVGYNWQVNRNGLIGIETDFTGRTWEVLPQVAE